MNSQFNKHPHFFGYRLHRKIIEVENPIIPQPAQKIRHFTVPRGWLQRSQLAASKTRKTSTACAVPHITPKGWPGLQTFFRSNWTVLNCLWRKPLLISSAPLSLTHTHTYTHTHTSQYPLRTVATLGHTWTTHFCYHTAHALGSRDISAGTVTRLLTGRTVTLCFPGRGNAPRPSACPTKRPVKSDTVRPCSGGQTAGTWNWTCVSVYCFQYCTCLNFAVAYLSVGT